MSQVVLKYPFNARSFDYLQEIKQKLQSNVLLSGLVLSFKCCSPPQYCTVLLQCYIQTIFGAGLDSYMQKEKKKSYVRDGKKNPEK